MSSFSLMHKILLRFVLVHSDDIRLDLLINFNVPVLRDGIRWWVLGLSGESINGEESECGCLQAVFVYPALLCAVVIRSISHLLTSP